jgi:hypothetical protein
MSKFGDYRYQTDNLVFPNTEEGWKKLGWKLHFSGGAILTIFHLLTLEYKARKNAEKGNTGNKDNVPQGILD